MNVWCVIRFFLWAHNKLNTMALRPHRGRFMNWFWIHCTPVVFGTAYGSWISLESAGCINRLNKEWWTHSTRSINLLELSVARLKYIAPVSILCQDLKIQKQYVFKFEQHTCKLRFNTISFVHFTSVYRNGLQFTATHCTHLNGILEEKTCFTVIPAITFEFLFLSALPTTNVRESARYAAAVLWVVGPD